MTAVPAPAPATVTATALGGIWRREAIAELKRTSRLPQFLLPTVLTPAAFYGLFTLAVAKAHGLPSDVRVQRTS